MKTKNGNAIICIWIFALAIAEHVLLHTVKVIQVSILEVILDKESSLFSSNNLYCKNVDFL